ncbi:MAG: ribose-phosphate diphosphokinase [Bacteroidia bacterium]|nr:ribose-phosphate diphosphokinase [Bacteroidia bacterium]
MRSMLVYATQNYQYFANLLVQDFAFKEGRLERNWFPDGESYHRILDSVTDQTVILVGGTINDQETMELFDLGCSLTNYGVDSLRIVIPYFGYSTMERAVKPGEVVKAKHRARLLSAIPSGTKNNEVLLMDLHAEGIPHYFGDNVFSVHLYAKEMVMAAIRELGGSSDWIVASTDAGRAKWVESLANEMGVEAAFVYKQRLSGTQTKVTGVNADVRGKTVVIYDDMIRTGGSLMKAAQAYLANGAKEIFAVTTHVIMPENARDTIQQSGLIQKIIGMNTHPRAYLLANDFLQIKNIAPIFGRYLTHFGGNIPHPEL